jgi:Ca2+/Na+ antiporter
MADLLKAISNNSIPFLWVTVFGLLIPFFWSYSKFKHRRYQNNILFFAFLLCVIRTFQILYSPSVIVTHSLYILCGAYLFIALRTANNLLFPESSPLFRLENLIREDNYDSIKIRFPQKPFYIQSTLGRMKWHSLWARKLLAQDRPREAYEIYSKLLTLPLFEEEKTDIKSKQVLSLLLLGDTNSAQHIFERIQNKAEELKCMG